MEFATLELWCFVGSSRLYFKVFLLREERLVLKSSSHLALTPGHLEGREYETSSRIFVSPNPRVKERPDSRIQGIVSMGISGKGMCGSGSNMGVWFE
jgi:hypothetical protein